MLIFRGLVFDYENYTRHVFKNDNAQMLLLKRIETFSYTFLRLNLVSFFFNAYNMQDTTQSQTPELHHKQILYI